MARRLPVVVSQSPTSDPERRAFEESLVTALLAERALDVSVIPHVERLERGGTGLVCLEGIVGPFAIAAWLDPEVTIACLCAHGISGRRGATSWDALESPSSRTEPAASARPAPDDLGESAPRTIYAVDLRRGAEVDSLIHELRGILTDSTIVTVSLHGPGSNGKSNGQASTGSAAPSGAAPPGATRIATRINDAKGTPRVNGNPAAIDSVSGPSSAQEQRMLDASADNEAETADRRLDRLVDELDQLDL